jgi:hypothetical protein
MSARARFVTQPLGKGRLVHSGGVVFMETVLGVRAISCPFCLGRNKGKSSHRQRDFRPVSLREGQANTTGGRKTIWPRALICGCDYCLHPWEIAIALGAVHSRRRRHPGALNVAYEAGSEGRVPGIGPMSNPLPHGGFDTNAQSWGDYG